MTRFDDLDGVGARLLADLQQHRRPRRRRWRRVVRLGLAVLDAARRRATRIGWPSCSRTTISPNSATDCDAAERAQRQRLRALVDAAAGNLDVLRLQRARDVGDGQVVGAQPVGVEPDVDLALRGRRARSTWPTPLTLSSCRRSDLVGELGDVADRLASAVTAMLSTGAASGSNFSTRGCSMVRGSSGSDAVDLVAHLLRGDVDVLLEQERDDDQRDALGRRSSAARRCR